ncbi:MAG: hypothetical protein GF315_04045 [candidate division Zixibacteria bacterium]|nr:hypothetical protein [candidate division Zixibacteria bacterium]
MSKIKASNIVLLLGVFFIIFTRVYLLSADAPVNLTGMQGPATDPPVYTSYARNQVLFDEAQPFGSERYILFVNSLPTFVGKYLFEIIGTGRVQFNLMAVLFNLIGLLFFSLSLKRGGLKHYAGWGTLILGVNYVFMMLNRLPFLENSVVTLLLVGTYFLLSSERRIKILIAGLLFGISTFFVKMLSAFIIPAAISYLWIKNYVEGRYPKTSILSTGMLLAGFISVAIVWIFSIYLPNKELVDIYLAESTTAIYGRPIILDGIRILIESIMRFGNDNYLFPLMPFTVLSVILFFIVFFAVPRKGAFRLSRFRELPVESWFFIAWLVFGILALFPWNYRPLRYAMLLIPAFAGIIVSIPLWQPPRVGKNFKTSLRIFPLFLWMILINLIVTAVIFHFEKPYQIPPVYPVVISVGILCFLTVFWLLRRKPDCVQKFCGSNSAKTTFGTIMLIILFFNIYLYGNWLPKAQFSSDVASKDIARITDEKAVIAGSYASALTQNNKLRSIPYFFGVTFEHDPALFDKYPITHLALDIGQNDLLTRYYPEISKGSTLIYTYWIRGQPVCVYNIVAGSENPEARQYDFSLFEKAVIDYKLDNMEKSTRHYKEFKQKYPESQAGYYLAGLLCLRRGDIDCFIKYNEMIIDTDPTNSLLYAQFGGFLEKLGKKYYQLAFEKYRKGLEYDPHNSTLLEAISRIKSRL